MQNNGVSYVTSAKEFEITSKLVGVAFTLADEAHKGVRRASGEPYITHPIAVASLLRGWGIQDENIIAAALLHDVIEDTSLTYRDVRKGVNKEVAELVENVSKLKSRSRARSDFLTLRKVLIKSYLDPRVAVLKLADRIHNMETLDALNPAKQKEKSLECVNVYARLAESLGIWAVKIILEDTAFRYIDPRLYKKTHKEIAEDERLGKQFLAYWTSNLKSILDEANIEGKVEIRKNGLWALAKKRDRAALMGRSRLETYQDINDVVSLRVVVPALTDCYQMVGRTHSRFGDKVDFGRYDEFIGGNKRENGYSALQTTLDLPEGAMEVAVMTKEMEDFNRWGVITLLRNSNVRKTNKRLEDYVLKLVFTPTAEVRFLPKQATGVDFAYAINPRMGADSVGLLVDGNRKPMSTVLPNASTVEVLVGETKRAPDKSYLKYCLPATARIIDDQLHLAERDQLVVKGRNKLEPVLAKVGVLVLEDLGDCLPRLMYRYGGQSVSDLYFKVGRGSLSPETITDWLKDQNISKKTQNWSTLKISGRDQPGVMKDVTEFIAKMGGNILTVSQDTTDNIYQLRIVMEKLEKKSWLKLREKVKSDTRFKTWKLV